jgi:uncharacterized membrane protein
MTQDEINQAEWQDPDNWTSPTGIAVYFSKADTRAWVPKREPWQGMTLNLGIKNGVRWFYGLFGSVVLLFNLVWIMAFVLTVGFR